MARTGLARVARQLAQQAGCWAADVSGTSSAAACTGMLHFLQQRGLHAAASQLGGPLGRCAGGGGLLTLRGFAADAGGSGSSSQPPQEGQQQPEPSTAAAAPAAAAAAALGSSEDEVGEPVDMDAALEEWGQAMEEGDWETAWHVFETAYPVDSEDFPSLEELQEWDPESEERAARRQREMEKQAEQAKRWVRVVDEQGRAHAAGKRKTSIARVWLREGGGHIMVNKKPFDLYFPSLIRRNDVIAPFEVTDTLGVFDVMVNVRGGGVMGQAQAVRHGIARALQRLDPGMRPELKTAGLLTRDARKVERKKVGREKARKGFQWVKR